MKKIPLFNKRALLRIFISAWLIWYVYSLFIAPWIFIFWGSAYFINLVWNKNQRPEIIMIGTHLKNPQLITIDWSPLFLKDDSRIFSTLGCPNTPATGFDAASFEGIGRGTGWSGIMVKDSNGTYITSNLEEGIYGRPICDTGIALPYEKVQ